jgi:oxygen-independent coproporphyrinogen-3 oxidase
VSFPDREDTFDKYIDAVLAEARLYAGYLSDHFIDTLFIGGGTPSLLSSEQIKRLINGLKSVCDFDLKEATIEANPETLDEEKLAAYAACGINRLSVGLQTHDNNILKAIGRRHTFEQFLNVYETARHYFSYINIDTIFGLPGQTTENFEETIKHIIELTPSHVSSYSLKLEQGTRLAETYEGADEDTDRDMYHMAAAMLGRSGYVHYETSNFAKEHAECLHNLKYWTGGEYLGLGVAAHSYITDTEKQRFSNTDDIIEYIQKIGDGNIPIVEKTVLSEADEITEFIMLRLRLKQGIMFDDFNRRFGTDFQTVFNKPIEFAVNAGLVIRNEHGIFPTLKGFDLQNTLITEFMKII